jgi:hypothetical protein
MSKDNNENNTVVKVLEFIIKLIPLINVLYDLLKKKPPAK